MTSFNELSAIIKFFKGRPLIKDIPLQLERPPKSKLEAFYQGIALGKYKDDADAAKSLYGQHQNHASYRRLKETFDKLILQLFLINFDYKGFSIESRNYFKNLVNLVSMRIILGIGNYFIPIELAKQGVKYATKSQQSEIGFLVSTAYSTLLREYPVSRENTLSVKIDQLSNTFFENLLIEIKIDKCFGIIVENLQKGGKQNAKEIGHAYETLLSTENKLDKVNALKSPFLLCQSSSKRV
ncbi:MAG: hypothetical protein IPG32_03910 [Saprospirales bacterium]|nr:hypothetical protein [Saprospirales bacterium]